MAMSVHNVSNADNTFITGGHKGGPQGPARWEHGACIGPTFVACGAPPASVLLLRPGESRLYHRAQKWPP